MNTKNEVDLSRDMGLFGFLEIKLRAEDVYKRQEWGIFLRNFALADLTCVGQKPEMQREYWAHII